MADILRMIVVLSALCGLSGFALSYLKMVTAPVIEEQVLTYVQGPAIAGVFTDIDNQPIADRKAFESRLEDVANAVELIMEGRLSEAQNRYNR